MIASGSWLTAPPRESFASSTGWRYGFGGVILLLFAAQVWHISSSSHHPNSGQLVMGFGVPLMLLLQHLAFNFRWPLFLTATLRILALSVTAFFLVWVIFH